MIIWNIESFSYEWCIKINTNKNEKINNGITRIDLSEISFKVKKKKQVNEIIRRPIDRSENLSLYKNKSSDKNSILCGKRSIGWVIVGKHIDRAKDKKKQLKIFFWIIRDKIIDNINKNPNKYTYAEIKKTLR